MTIEAEKNILVVVRQPVGGIRAYLTYIFSASAFSDFRFTFLLHDVEEAHVLKEEMRGVNSEFIFVKGKGAFGGLLSASIRALSTGKYSLVHSHGFTAGVAVSYAARLFRVPHILTIHEMLSEAQFVGSLGMLKKMLLRMSLSQINTIHSVTRDSQQNLVRFIPSLAGTKNKMVIINNGVDLDKFENAPARDLRAELNLSSGTVIAGFFGRFMPPKGFDTIIQAVQLLSMEGVTHKDIVVVATRTGGFYREDFNRVMKMNLGDYFRLIDHEPNIASVLKGVDMLLVPSRSEAGPILPMEAMCVGVPVIGTKCIGLREVLAGTPSVQIDPEDASALADGIRKLLNFDQRMPAQEFADEAKDRFSIAKTAEQVSNLYRNMANMSVKAGC